MFAITYPQYAIISVEMDTFSGWLLRELEHRGWNQAELHRKSGLSKTIISDVISDKVTPGYEFCIAIGKALQVPPESVMRLAGLLPPVPAKTEQSEQLLYLFNQLDPDKKQDLLGYAEFLTLKK